MRPISFSEISTYLTCREKHRRQYVLREPEKFQPRLIFGTIVHAGLEAGIRSVFNREQDPYEALALGCESSFKEEIAKVPESQREEIVAGVTDASTIAHKALKWLDPDRWETQTINGRPTIEIELSAPVFDDIRFKAVIDWVARDKTDGTMWAFEFKTRKQLTPVALGEISLQQALYQHVLRLNGCNVDGSTEFAIKASLPSEPKLNKNGTMSRAACTTDWETYKAALIRNNLDPVDYYDVQVDLMPKEFFRLVPQYRTEEECKRTWDRVVKPTARELRSSGLVSTEPIPILTRHVCRSCPHLEPCLEEIRGYAQTFGIEVLEEENVI